MAIQEPPAQGTNLIGLTKNDYKGRPSTLCKGCGHDSISARIISVAYDLSIQPTQLIKLSGIGCSSKTPAYFLSQSHGFNGLHGRMPSMATGALLANSTLKAIGISGDGDTGSIGLGQYIHMVRRNVPVVYIVENNGVYGLTKGQFSATADAGSKSKKGAVNTDAPVDMVGMALQLGASFVARSFSGDKHQLVPILKAAMSHQGAAFVDVISPCVAFNNHPGSTKSYDYVREHNHALCRMDFISPREEITVEYPAGEIREVRQHDGSVLRLRKLPDSHDTGDRVAAMNYLHAAQARGEIVTGLLYVDPEAPDLHAHLDTAPVPLNALGERELCPGSAALAKINAGLR